MTAGEAASLPRAPARRCTPCLTASVQSASRARFSMSSSPPSGRAAPRFSGANARGTRSATAPPPRSAMRPQPVTSGLPDQDRVQPVDARPGEQVIHGAPGQRLADGAQACQEIGHEAGVHLGSVVPSRAGDDAFGQRRSRRCRPSQNRPGPRFLLGSARLLPCRPGAPGIRAGGRRRSASWAAAASPAPATSRPCARRVHAHRARAVTAGPSRSGPSEG